MSSQIGTELILQQQWRIYDYEADREMHVEWRDVPIVEEGDEDNIKLEASETDGEPF